MKREADSYPSTSLRVRSDKQKSKSEMLDSWGTWVVAGGGCQTC